MSHPQNRRTENRSSLNRAVRAAMRCQLFEMLETRQLLSGAPTITSGFTVTVNHAGSTALSAQDFENEYSDPGDAPLASIQITTLPADGTFSLAGGDTSTPITAGQVIPADELGNLTYTPNSLTVNGVDTFIWTASDGTLSSNQASGSITVLDNFPPVEGNFGVNVLPNTTQSIPPSDFSNNFSDQDANDTLQSITITVVPTHGNLALNGTHINANATIAASDLSQLTYTPTANYHQGDTFSFTASDGEKSSAAAAVSLNVGTLSVAGTTTAGLTTIASGDTTPSAADSTDFGFNATGNNAFTDITRTFTITNNSGSTITLNGAKLVTVTGGNASDFIVTQPSGPTLAAGASTTFTIEFKPTGTGLRKTTVSIASNAATVSGVAGESPYTFTIQGTGLSVTKNANGVEYATTVKGTGTGAATNDLIELTLTGTLPNGQSFVSPFDTTPGEEFSFVLGNAGLDDSMIPAGWNVGLAGIKAGETRDLLIPAAEAYGGNGTTGDNNVPPDSEVLYTVTALSVQQPDLVVKGTDETVIPAGDKTLSLTNGTNLGITNDGTSGTLTSTFHLSDGGGGLLAYTNDPGVTLTGTGAASFTLTQPVVPTGGSSADFTISFTPNGSHGIKTATVNIHTNDPLHPDFTFNIQAGFQQVDLVPSLKATNFPATAIISGSGKSVTLPVVITNSGIDAVPSGSVTNIQVWAHTDAGDTLLQTFTNESVSGLAGNGGTKTFNLTVTPPLGFGSGTAAYTLFTKINTDGAITETNTDNDTSSNTTQSVTITQGHVDIVGNLVSTTLLPQIATGTSVAGNVVVALSNAGNVPLPSNQQVTVAIELQGTNGTTTLKTFTQSVGGLGNTPKNYTFSVTAPNTLTADTYNIIAVVTPVQTLATEDASNNTISTTGTGGNLTVTVAAPFTNIGGSLKTVTLTPAIGVATLPVKGTVAVTVENTGNQKLASGQQVTIALFAVNTSNQTPTQLNTATAATKYSVGSLGLNQTSTFNVAASLTDGLPAGTYDIEAVVTPVQAITNVAPVTISTDTNGDTVGYTSDAVTNNLIADHLTASSNLTKTRTAATNETGTVTVRLTNAGNVPIPQGETVQIVVNAHNTTTDTDIQLATSTVSVSLWKVGQQQTFSISVNTANALGLVAGTYNIQAVATPVQTLNESITSDNTTPEVVTMTLT